MSDAFRALLKKVGSGPHTGKDLSRSESAAATRMMLTQEATPAQIGAFMIAQRIKRPTGEELAGILDAYEALGPCLQPISAPYPTLVMGIPYDGRSRTAPCSPLVALILATIECPVLHHGGIRMPTKYGIPLIELWQGLGVDWSGLSLTQVQSIFAATKLGFVYLPSHFPAAHDLVIYRDQIGKRPSLATAELLWCPYMGDRIVISGYVHPPTEALFQKTSILRQVPHFITVKGLEGSCDLPRDRTSIIGINQPGQHPAFERILLPPRDYDMAAAEVPLPAETELFQGMQAVLAGTSSELTQLTLWNAGFFLWRCGHAPSLKAGMVEAEALLQAGVVLQTLNDLKLAVEGISKGDRHIPSEI